MLEFNLGQVTTNQNDLKCNIISSLNVPELDALQRYMYATVLQRAAADAAAALALDAIKFAQDEKNGCQPEAGAGKDFVHLGSTFRLTYKSDYNYNQGDELGKEWVSADKERTKLRKSAKSLTDYIAALQTRILVLHPRLEPTETKVSISYYDK